MMIRKGMMFGGLAAIALLAGSAMAAGPKPPTPTPGAWPFPVKGAALYKTDFARAENACAPRPGPWGIGVVTVQVDGTVPGQGSLPQMGCVADPNQLSPMQYGKAELVLNSKHGLYVLSGAGFPVATQVDLVLTVQVTRKLVATTLLGSKTVTFPEQTATCPTTIVNAKGVLLQKDYLDDCLSYQLVDPTPNPVIPKPIPGGSENSKFPMVNVQVQSAKLVDHVTSLTIGTAGIVR